MLHFDNAEEYADQVRKGFCEELTIYEANEQDHSLDMAATYAYREAIDICGKWLREVLLEELAMHPEYDTVRCSLNLPAGDLEMEVGVKVCGASAGGMRPQIMQTPIGDMSDVVLRTILMNEDNPVTVLFKHLGVLSHHIHNLLAMRGQEDTIITQDILMANGIQDTLMIHEMDGILYNIDEFFKMYE